MRRKKQEVLEEAAPRGPGPVVLAWRFLTTLLLLAIVFYIAALLLSRTEGFRTLVAERIERATGLEVKIAKSRCTAGSDVVLEEVKLVETGSVVRAAASCGRALVVWHLPRPFGGGRPAEVTLADAEVSMARQDGVWHPAAFADTAALVASWIRLPLPDEKKPAARPSRDAGAKPDDEWAAWAGPRVQLALTGGRLTWWTDRAEPAAEVAGLRLTVTPLEAPDRPMMHYLIEASRVSAQGVPLAAPLRMERLDAGDQQIVLGFLLGQEKPAPATR